MRGLLSFGYTPQTGWQTLYLGAGGYSTGLSIANDGTIYARSDTLPGGARLDYGAIKWVPFFTPTNFSVATYGNLFTGQWDVVTPPTNSNVAYVVQQASKAGVLTNYVFKTTDRGATWNTPAGFPSYSGSLADPNGGQKFINQKSAIDPANENHVLIWYPGTQGLYESFDAGATAGVIGNGLPVGTSGSCGGAGLVFDPTSGTTTRSGHTVTNRIITNVWSQGMWESTDGGASFNSINTAAPNTVAFTTTTTNCIIVLLIQVFGSTAARVSGVANNAGDPAVLSWLKRAGPITNSAGFSMYEYYAVAASAGTYNITVSSNAATTISRVNAFGIAGANTSSPFDPNLSNAGTSTSGAATITTTNANDFIFSFNHNTSTTADAGYAIIEAAHPSNFFSEYGIVSSTQSGLSLQGTGGSSTDCSIMDAIVQSTTLALNGTPAYQAVSFSSSPISITSGSCNPWTTGSYLTKRYWCGEKQTNTGNTKTWQYNDDNTWTEIKYNNTGTPTSFEAWATCPDPATPGRVWIVGTSCTTAIETLDNAATFPLNLGQWSGNTNIPPASGGNQWTFNNVDIPWLGITFSYSGTQIAPVENTGDAAFNPAGTNRLEMACGTGMRYYNPPSTFVAFKTNILSLGIEQLDSTFGGSSVPNGLAALGNEDRGYMMVGASVSLPPAHYVFDISENAFNLSRGTGFDWATADSTFLVAAVSQQGGYSGKSTNGGSTWSFFTKNPVTADSYPALACASSTNAVMAILDSTAWNTGIGPGGTDLAAGVPIYTTDGGATWNTCQHSSGDGGGNLPSTGWITGEERPLWTDRITVGTYWIRNINHGLYQSTDSGATWTLLTTTGISFKRSEDNPAKGRSAPYDYTKQAGWTSDLWYAGIANYNDTLWNSTDGGLTWSSIAAVSSVRDWDFGAPQTPGGFASLLVLGTVNSHFGVSISADHGATWAWLGVPSQLTGQLSYDNTVVGDGQTYGKCYLGFQGGWAVYNP